mmetsp:Transcript_4101/g.8270  ORF Transcript_4101/g.8270 Transcript_4101/m.8270 type:complete len:383 (-) Transcript_4101:337-1485(-)
MGYSWGETERGFDKRPNQIIGMPTGAMANNKTIEQHKVRPFLEPKETDRVSVAFLARAPHKFVEKLGNESVNVRREALDTMSRWLLAHPNHKAAQVDAGAIPALTELLKDGDQLVREKSAVALALLGSIHQGVQAMLACKTIEMLLVVINSTETPETRKNAHSCIQLMGNYPEGVEAIVEANGTSRLVEVCTEDVSTEALLSLKCCLQNQNGLNRALQGGACKIMVDALRNESAPVVQFALRNLALLTGPSSAKQEAIQRGAIKPIVVHLRHEAWPVRAAATGALMSIVIDVEGKKQACDHGAIDVLIEMLYDPYLPVVLLGVRCLGNLAECKREVISTPLEGIYNTTFDKALPQLSLLMQSPDRVLAKASRDTADLIKWRP